MTECISEGFIVKIVGACILAYVITHTYFRVRLK